MTSDLLLGAVPLGNPPWPTLDPFLFCVHHDDAYPRGNEAMGPAASLAGRELGMDFAGKDGWRMYHGRTIPGFPSHPHRGFETVTVARRGYIDHSDSLGATARFGQGDAQWMTAGDGIVHSEMFPLLNRVGDNPAELFQIWLNLPARKKRVAPYFAMLWDEQIPRVVSAEGSAPAVATVVAGNLGGATPPACPPDSWAADPDNDVAIVTLRLAPGSRFSLPAARPGTHRILYFFAGTQLTMNGVAAAPRHALQVRATEAIELVAADACELLLLQGRPIGEPIVQHGPFVMNSQAEVQEAFADYRRTQFGGWPWPSNDPVHGREEARFARHADGRLERPATPA
jgi:quercetin 2,3-dioxygenase